MSAAGPGRPVRCSPLEAWYRRRGPHSQRVEDMALPAEPAAPAGPAIGLCLRDLSWRRRFGCKGLVAEAWLAGSGLQAPRGANTVRVDALGILVARLATSEFLVEALGDGAAAIAVEAARVELESMRRPTGVYPVARQDLVVEVSGPATNALLRQICNVDFAPLLQAGAAPESALLLTSMVGVGVVAWPRGGAEAPAVTLWSDPSFAFYFWTTLLEVGGDLPGGVAVIDPVAAGEATAR